MFILKLIQFTVFKWGLDPMEKGKRHAFVNNRVEYEQALVYGIYKISQKTSTVFRMPVLIMALSFLI